MEKARKARPRAAPDVQEPALPAFTGEWDAVSIYARLGENVKPETAALAKRIREAYLGKDFVAEQWATCREDSER